MKITMYMIKDFLGEAVLAERIHAGYSNGTVESVGVFDPSLDTSSECVYIVECRHICKFRDREYEGSFLFLGGKISEIPQNLKNDCLLLQEDKAITVLQKLEYLFEKYQKWELELYQAAVSSKGIRCIAMTAANLIENPFFLYTSSMKLIFSCNLTEAAENRFRASRYYEMQEEGTYVSDCFLKKIKEDPERWEAMQESGPRIISDSDLGYRTLSYNISAEGVCRSRLVICEIERSLNCTDFFVLQMLGEFLMPFLEEEDMIVNAHSVSFDRCLRKLLEGGEIGDIQLRSVLEDFGWDSRDRYFCAYIPADPEMAARNLLAPVCFHLEVTCPNSAAILFDDHIVHIMNLTNTDANTESVRRTLARMYREKKLSAGISPEFSGIYGLAERYRQAEAAYVLGRGREKAQGCFLYENYMLQDLLRNFTDSYSLETLCPEQIRVLIEYDRRNHMQYMRLLKIYLQNDRNIAKSIRALGMQRSKFLYQLQRILTVTGLNLDDYNTRLFLQLYFAAEEAQLFGEGL